MEKHIYSLSYDIAQLGNQSLDDATREKAYDTFLAFVLYDIILIDGEFTIVPQPTSCNNASHRVLKPVESTLVFYSELKGEEIAQKVNEFNQGKEYQIHYIINEIACDRIIGYSHVNPVLQNALDDKINLEFYSIKSENQCRKLEELMDQLEHICSQSMSLDIE